MNEIVERFTEVLRRHLGKHQDFDEDPYGLAQRLAAELEELAINSDGVAWSLPDYIPLPSHPTIYRLSVQKI